MKKNPAGKKPHFYGQSIGVRMNLGRPEDQITQIEAS